MYTYTHTHIRTYAHTNTVHTYNIYTPREALCRIHKELLVVPRQSPKLPKNLLHDRKFHAQVAEEQAAKILVRGRADLWNHGAWRKNLAEY
jgi:hypothetical protein